MKMIKLKVHQSVELFIQDGMQQLTLELLKNGDISLAINFLADCMQYACDGNTHTHDENDKYVYQSESITLTKERAMLLIDVLQRTFKDK